MTTIEWIMDGIAGLIIVSFVILFFFNRIMKRVLVIVEDALQKLSVVRLELDSFVKSIKEEILKIGSRTRELEVRTKDLESRKIPSKELLEEVILTTIERKIKNSKVLNNYYKDKYGDMMGRFEKRLILLEGNVTEGESHDYAHIVEGFESRIALLEQKAKEEKPQQLETSNGIVKLTREESADYLGVSVGYLKNLCRSMNRDRLPYTVLNNRIAQYTKEDLDIYRENYMNEAEKFKKFNRKEAAEYLGVTHSHLATLSQHKYLLPYTIEDTNAVYLKKDLDRYRDKDLKASTKEGESNE